MVDIWSWIVSIKQFTFCCSLVIEHSSMEFTSKKPQELDVHYHSNAPEILTVQVDAIIISAFKDLQNKDGSMFSILAERLNPIIDFKGEECEIQIFYNVKNVV